MTRFLCLAALAAAAAQQPTDGACCIFKLKKTRFGLAARRGPAPKKSSVGGWRRLSRRLKTAYLASLAGKDEFVKRGASGL